MSERRRQRPIEEIEVSMHTWSMGHGYQILTTFGLGPCIGIATYDSRTKIGHLIHTADPRTEVGVFSPFLASVVEHTDDVSRLQVWVRGGELLPSQEDVADGEEIRKYTLEQLGGIGIRPDHLDVQWLKSTLSEGMAVDMSLDCSTGECAITTEGALPEEWNLYDEWEG